MPNRLERTVNIAVTDKPFCRLCRPDLMPDGGRINPEHIAIRFGDQARFSCLEVYMDGTHIGGIMEVYPGYSGFCLALVLCENGKPTRCHCGAEQPAVNLYRGPIQAYKEELKRCP